MDKYFKWVKKHIIPLPYKMVKRTQTIRRLLPMNCLNVFDHFVRLALYKSTSGGFLHYLFLTISLFFSDWNCQLAHWNLNLLRYLDASLQKISTMSDIFHVSLVCKTSSRFNKISSIANTLLVAVTRTYLVRFLHHTYFLQHELALMSLRTALVLLLNLYWISSICPWQKEFSQMTLKLLELLQSLKQVMKIK